MKIGRVFSFLLCFLLFVCVACTGKNSSQEKGARVVNLAIWSNYISPELLDQFEKKTGIKVEVSNYSSNEELLAKLQAGASGYDVVVPSDYMVEVMAKLGLVSEIDFSQLKNAKALDPKYLKKAFDPQNRYSVPYDWGTTGFAINRNLFKGRLQSWKEVFSNPELAGRFSLLDDGREVVGTALKYLGYSLNSTQPEELERAKKVLLSIRSRIKAFTSEPLMPLVHGEVAVAQIFGSDALQARRMTGGQIEYILPAEGASIWIDNLVIPKTSDRQKEAHQLIDFLLEPSSSLSAVTRLFLAPTNKGTFSMLPTELKTNMMLFPPEVALEKYEMLHDLGDSMVLWDKIWTEVKAH